MEDLMERPLCFFDLETTGTNVAKDRIVEIALYKQVDKIVHTYHAYVNPTIPVPAEATAVHGLSMDTLQYEKTFAQLAPEIHEFIKGCDLAGHNIMRLDVPILVEEFVRVGIPFPEAGISFVDTFYNQAKIAPRTLGYVYETLTGKKFDDQKGHTAMYDTKCTVEVYDAQVKGWAQELGGTRAELHKLATNGKHIVDFDSKLTMNEAGLVVYNFGKNVGKRVTSDMSYMDWMLKGDFTLDTKRWITDCIKHHDNFYDILKARDLKQIADAGNNSNNPGEQTAGTVAN